MASAGGHWLKISKGGLAGRMVFQAAGTSKQAAIAKVKAGKTGGMTTKPVAGTAQAAPLTGKGPKEGKPVGVSEKTGQKTPIASYTANTGWTVTHDPKTGKYIVKDSKGKEFAKSTSADMAKQIANTGGNKFQSYPSTYQTKVPKVSALNVGYKVAIDPWGINRQLGAAFNGVVVHKGKGGLIVQTDGGGRNFVVLDSKGGFDKAFTSMKAALKYFNLPSAGSLFGG